MPNLDAIRIPKSESIAFHFRDIYLHTDTYPRLLQRFCEEYPHFPIYSLLNKEGEQIQKETRTFLQLAHQATSIAEWMSQKQGVARGDRVMLVFFPSVDFMVSLWACYLGGFIAVTIPPPVRLSTDLPTFSALIKRCEAKFCLSHNTYYNFSSVQSISSAVTGFFSTRTQTKWPDIQWLYVDKVIKSCGSPPSVPEVVEKLKVFSSKVSKDDLAYLQLTSGSTSLPKMVRCTHGAALYNTLTVTGNAQHVRNRINEENYHQGAHPWACDPPAHPLKPEYHRTTIVWVPHYHDFFFGMANSSIIYCTTFCIMSPMDFLSAPLNWLKANIRLNGFQTCAPNFAFDYICNKSRESDRLALIQSQPVWRSGITQGGEPLQQKSVDNFLKHFPFISRNLIYNCYGMAEALAGISIQAIADQGDSIRYIPKGLCATGEEVDFLPGDHPGARACFSVGSSVLPIKRGVENTRLIVAHPETLDELPERTIGELWVSSPNIGKGYYGWDESDNADVFEVLPNETITAEPHRLFLRTGDRGFIDDGMVYIVGRYKATLILRGRNFEPSDIEYVVWNCNSNLRPGCCVALSIPNEDLGTDELVFVAEVRDESLGTEVLDQIAEKMRSQLAEAFGLVCPEILFFGPKKGVPKTSSGKPRRNAILENYMTNNWKPLYAARANADQIPIDYFANTEAADRPEGAPSPGPSGPRNVGAVAHPPSPGCDTDFPEGAEAIIEKIMTDIGRAEGEEESDKPLIKRQGGSILDEPLQAFSVASSDLVRLQSLVNQEFGVYVPSGTLLQMDMNLTVRQFFGRHVFSPDIRPSSPQLTRSPASRRANSPSRARPSSPSRSRGASPSRRRASEQNLLASAGRSSTTRTTSPSRSRKQQQSPQSVTRSPPSSESFSVLPEQNSRTPPPSNWTPCSPQRETSTSPIRGASFSTSFSSSPSTSFSSSPSTSFSSSPSTWTRPASRDRPESRPEENTPERRASMKLDRRSSIGLSPGRTRNGPSPRSSMMGTSPVADPVKFGETRATSFAGGAFRGASPKRSDSFVGNRSAISPHSSPKNSPSKGSRLSLKSVSSIQDRKRDK